jgi:EAL domain-containing protein (putative c-di-GMP-specific phosphodiesterase class I)
MFFSPDNIIAYFQPILSADSHTVYSYEVLGRFVDSDGVVKSLGPFFSDANTTDEDARKIDQIVRRYALKKYAEEKRNEYLFLNIRLAWLEKFVDKPEELPTIRWVQEFDINPNRIVIEITEEEFNAKDAHINVLAYYRNAGFRIALDDYGKNASNIDRLAKIHPDIIKINIDYIHKSEKSYHYREYLKSLTTFAGAVGIEVLYEGVETQQQLDICMSSGGRFYQGFLIAKPQASMQDAIINQLVFSTSTENAYKEQHERILHADTLKKSLDFKIMNFLYWNPSFIKEFDIYLPKLCRELPEVSKIYLCNKRGNQISYNFEWHSGDVISYDYRGKSWAWRGFFQEALETFIAGRKSYLSTIYRDFTTKKRIFTYFYALDEDVFFFADINTL